MCGLKTKPSHDTLFTAILKLWLYQNNMGGGEGYTHNSLGRAQTENQIQRVHVWQSHQEHTTEKFSTNIKTKNETRPHFTPFTKNSLTTQWRVKLGQFWAELMPVRGDTGLTRRTRGTWSLLRNEQPVPWERTSWAQGVPGVAPDPKDNKMNSRLRAESWKTNYPRESLAKKQREDEL